MATASIVEIDDQQGSVQVSGLVDFDSVSTYRAAGEKLIKANTSNELQFDLSMTELSGSIGISLLLCWTRYAEARNKKATFIHVPKNLCEMIRVSGVEQILAYD